MNPDNRNNALISTVIHAMQSWITVDWEENPVYAQEHYEEQIYKK